MPPPDSFVTNPEAEKDKMVNPIASKIKQWQRDQLTDAYLNLMFLKQ